MVDDADGAIGLSDKLQGLIDVLHLVVVRMWRTVRRNQSIDAEWSVVRLVAKVATVVIFDYFTIYDFTISMRRIV